MLEQAKARLPFACEVVFLADRGFADTQLMGHLRDLGWHWRIRIKANFWMHPTHLDPFRWVMSRCSLGHMSFWHGVAMTDKRFGPVHLAVARPLGSEEYWYVISDEAAELKTFEEYGLRFDIEENFLDDKSNGFQLEDSLIRSAERAGRCWGLCRNRHLLHLKVYVRIPALKNGAQLPVQRSYSRLQ